MQRIDKDSYATLAFTLTWQSAEARHEERFLGRKANLWRDIFPADLAKRLVGLAPGETASVSCAPGEAIPGHDPRLVARLPAAAYTPPRIANRAPVPARAGRFYPRGLFTGGMHGLYGVFPQDARPARVLEADGETLLVDQNHPLAGRAFTLAAEVQACAPKRSDTGGRLAVWLEEICDYGPGMQARRDSGATDFSPPPGPWRIDDTPDAAFYAAPRMVGHIDAGASELLRGAYARRIAPGSRVLDLMSSLASHLPEEGPGGPGLTVTGLGMNAEEMAANPRLANHVTHDLNQDPVLPFADASFEAVTCSLSVEYLRDPGAVLAECGRVLAPGGRLLLGFSDRWFPGKASALWMDLHPFERMGWALDLMRKCGVFADFETESARNWWRPEDDPHIRRTWTGDPVFVVAGTRRQP